MGVVLAANEAPKLLGGGGVGLVRFAEGIEAQIDPLYPGQRFVLAPTAFTHGCHCGETLPLGPPQGSGDPATEVVGEVVTVVVGFATVVEVGGEDVVEVVEMVVLDTGTLDVVAAVLGGVGAVVAEETLVVVALAGGVVPGKTVEVVAGIDEVPTAGIVDRWAFRIRKAESPKLALGNEQSSAPEAAVDIKRCQISAGSEPPETFATPFTSNIGPRGCSAFPT